MAGVAAVAVVVGFVAVAGVVVAHFVVAHFVVLIDLPGHGDFPRDPLDFPY